MNVKNGVYLVDSEYGRKNLAAVYLIVQDGKVALVETAHNRSLTHVLDKLTLLGLSSEDLEYIFLTHIHLDHAGGAGAYMNEFSNAKLVVHPKGIRHMINPSKLEASVKLVYGEQFVHEMYGQLQPISPDRIITGTDGLQISFNGRVLECRDTPGHANHHNIIIDHAENIIFTGDIFGVAYPELVGANGEQLFYPTTSPINFDPAKMFASISLIEELNPQAVYLTHYNMHKDIHHIATVLKQMLGSYLKIAEQYRNLRDRVEDIQIAVTNDFLSYARKAGCGLSDNEIVNLIQIDMNLNAQGIDVWLASPQ